MEYAVSMLFEGGSSKFGAAESMEFNLGNFKCEQIMLYIQMALQNPLPCQDTLKPPN